MKYEINYWIVGAMWAGCEDQYKSFIENKIWYLGWDDEDQPKQSALRDLIRPGDWIAIKRMLGRGSSEIEIRSIGVVNKIDQEKTVHVDWLETDLQRKVPSRGCYASIHGPFIASDPWVRMVFSTSNTKSNGGIVSSVKPEELSHQSVA